MKVDWTLLLMKLGPIMILMFSSKFLDSKLFVAGTGMTLQGVSGVGYSIDTSLNVAEFSFEELAGLPQCPKILNCHNLSGFSI